MRSVLTTLCLLATTAHAVPAQFTHQGRLLDADGVPLEGEATIKFRVTDSEEGGDTLWEETLTVSLSSGFYSAVLGTDEEENPLDTEVLSQAPVWLELQLDGEPAMFPRSAINAVPYATMATVAEEVAGGPVDASQIAVDGTPVVNELGEWVGPAPTINWSDIEGMPEDFADGVDDDTDTDTDSFAALGTSCLDGDIAVWDGVAMDWVCDLDRDTLADLACTDGQLIAWSDESTGFVCANDADTVLTEGEVDAMVADNGYAMASEVFSTSFLDLTDVPDGLLDGDDDTQLTEEQVDAMVADNGYAMAADAFSGSYTDLADTPALFSGSFLDLADVPEGLSDGDDNTGALGRLSCEDGETVSYDAETTAWVCAADKGDSAVLGSATAEDDGFTIVLAGEQLATATSSGRPASLANALISNGTHVQGVAMSGFSTCSECGTGADGSFTVPDISPTASLASGEYNFVDFTVPAGVTLTITGSSPLIIRATGLVRIEGTIDLSGEDGGILSEGSAAGGAGGPGGTSGTSGIMRWSDNYAGTNGTYDDSWHAFSRTSFSPLTGGRGGTGNCSDRTTSTGGGGGGGGVLAIAAKAIVVSGELLLNGGTGPSSAGDGSGGTAWLRASHVSIPGSINVSGGETGIVRIDTDSLFDDLLDSRTRGTTADLPPAKHLYQTTAGEITFANNTTESVEVDIRFVE